MKNNCPVFFDYGNEYEKWEKSTFSSKRHSNIKFLCTLINLFSNLFFIAIYLLLSGLIILNMPISHSFLKYFFVFIFVLGFPLIHLYLFKNKRDIIFKRMYLSLIRK